MYHSISDTQNKKFRQFAVSPLLFAEQMAYLHQHAYSPITVTQLMRALAQEESVLPANPVVLTFDDGFADFFTDALPVLKRYRFPATLYVPTAFVGSTSRWLQREGEVTRPVLTWEQLYEIQASGIECGGHTHTHPQLDTLPSALAREEIVRSKSILEQHLEQAVLSFAYPFGYYTTTIKRLVREAGYTSACAVKHAMSTETTDPFALTRLMVTAETTVSTLTHLLSGSGLSAAATLYMRARTPAWQVIRRGSALVTRHLQERTF